MIVNENFYRSIIIVLMFEKSFCWSIISPFKTVYETLKDNSVCRLTECCNSNYIKADLQGLRDDLKQNLYGQHLVKKIVLSSLEDHFSLNSPQKALTLSFHGSTGIGKNYVVKFIVENLYINGFQSKFVHTYLGQHNFPEKSMVSVYQKNLIADVESAMSSCEHQLFVFDEVDKIPAGVLDVLKPLFDTHEHINNKNFRKAVFIFISNTGGSLITETLSNLLNRGHLRENLKLSDFEHLIRLGAFNEDGGFHYSDTIESNLIDHYIPFLPLTRKHVEQCIVKEFNIRGVFKPSQEQINEVLEYITFQGEFASTGCKRISQKVGQVVQTKRLDTKWEL